MLPVYILLGILVALSGYVAWKLTTREAADDGMSGAEYDRLKAELDRKIEDITALTSKLNQAQSEKDELSGKGKALYDNFKNLEADLKALQRERDSLQRRVAEFEEAEERKEKTFADRLAKLEAANLSLEEERRRVIREDEERRQRVLEERDRLWADHENGVISTLTDLCKQPIFSFTSFTNTNLPEGFDGSLKPDFMIEFLDQYVIFDAKVSKAKSLQTYINTQVKDTVAKVKDNDKIYKYIFLVVPASALGELKSHYHMVDGFTLFIVPPEALPAILSSLKRITLYEFAEQMDPQQRENIIQMIAELDFHINLRNAADIILSKMGTEILDKARRIDPAISSEVEIKKRPMNAKASIAAAEVKRIVQKLTTQDAEIQKIVSPSTPIRKKDLQAAESVLSDSLF